MQVTVIGTWTWREGAQCSSLDPQVIGQEINKLTNGNGKITVDQYVKEAENPTSPLHETLTWDNEHAANLWRKKEAREVIKSLMYQEVPTAQREPYMFNTERNKGTYTKTTVIKTNPDLREHVLKDAIRELKQFRDKYVGITELMKVINEIEELIKKWQE